MDVCNREPNRHCTNGIEKMENKKKKDLVIENWFHKRLVGQISFPDPGIKIDIVELRGLEKDGVDSSK